jgi:hypothetical protein
VLRADRRPACSGGAEHPIDVTAVENVATALRLSAGPAATRAAGVYNITNGDPRPFARPAGSTAGPHAGCRCGTGG